MYILANDPIAVVPSARRGVAPEEWFIGALADEFATSRSLRRKKQERILYDCRHAVVDGLSVRCGIGEKLYPNTKKQHNADLLMVLEGTANTGCRRCKEFEFEKGGVD